MIYNQELLEQEIECLRSRFKDILDSKDHRALNKLRLLEKKLVIMKHEEKEQKLLKRCKDCFKYVVDQ